MTVSERLRMPSLARAIEWVGSDPLGADDLRGHVVLVNFWTWTCINWLRQAPYVRAWSQAYRQDGLIVIGVHTPEFSFEHDIDGVCRDHHFGEGRYEKLERVIQKLLGVDRGLVSVEGAGVEAAADWDHLRTPETYLGSSRSGQDGSPPGASLDRHRLYTVSEGLRLGHWALAGEWTIRPEYVVLDQAGGSIAFRFHARDAHLVLSRGAPQPIPFRVSLDGEAPGPSAGVDIDADGNGVLRDDRMYQLVRQHDVVRDRTLEISFLQPGANAHSFTFG